MSNIKQYIILVFIIFTMSGCLNSDQIEEARAKSNSLLNSIANGNIEGLFPTKYFPPDQTDKLMNGLRYECDFINRKGHFVNDFYSYDMGVKSISFLYEFFLKCDTVRIITTYKLGDTVELYVFKIEGIEKENSMILKPENGLLSKTKQ